MMHSFKYSMHGNDSENDDEDDWSYDSRATSDDDSEST